MNNANEMPEIDGRLFDRLVDGELNDREERQLLARLDDEPAGWRQCALAFLEARCWKRECRAVANEAAPAAKVSLAASDRPWRLWSPGALAGIAACFLIAFGLGVVGRGLWSGGGNLAVESPSGVAPAGTENVQLVSDPAAGQTGPRWQTVRLRLGDSAGDGQSLNVPVVEGANMDETWVQNQGSAVPPDVVRVLERMGHEVQQERQLWPIQLDDGRRGLVPVDDVKVRYVGNPSYQ
ncbi:MAG: hypothetical protein ACYC35_23045 [Pirellulales bacterium]